MLLIGCAAYQAPGLPDLPGVTRNIDRLATLLSGKRPPSALRVLHNPRSPDAILAALDLSAREARDMLVVYYAGHGVTHVGTRLYLALADMDPARPHQSAGIDARVLCEKIARSPAACKVLILDCCHSGRALNCAVWDDPAGRAHFVWAATGPDTPARQFAPDGGRVFDGRVPTLFTELLIDQLQRNGTSMLADLAADVGSALESRGYPRPVCRSAGGAEVRCLRAVPAPVPAQFTATGRAGPVRVARLLIAITFVPSAFLICGALLMPAAGSAMPYTAIPAMTGAYLLQYRLRSIMPSRRVLHVTQQGMALDLGTRHYVLTWTEVEDVTVSRDSRVLVRLRPGSAARHLRGLWRSDGPRPAAEAGLLQFCTLGAFKPVRAQAENAIADHAGWRWRDTDARSA